MSEEEIVEILKDNIKSLKNPIPFRHTNEEKIQAIQGLLDLYNKEKEKNKELERYEEAYKLLSYGLNNYISKDKIREKIEEIYSYAYTTQEEKDEQHYAISILKELLEENK